MKRKLLAIIGILLVFSLSCSFLTSRKQSNSEEPVEVGIEKPRDLEDEDEPSTGGNEGKDEQTSDDGDGTFSLDSGALEQLDYYRSRIVMHNESADGKVEESVIETAYIREPSAQHLIMQSNNEEGIEMIQIEDQMWMKFGDEWMQTSADEGEEIAKGFGDFLMDNNDIANLEDSDYEYIGKENVNDVQTRHYRAKYTLPWMMGFLGGWDDVDVKESNVDFWVVDDSDLPTFVVKTEMKIEGVVKDKTTLFTLSQDITDINKPFTIEPPSPEDVGGLPEGVPLYPGATGVTTIGGMTIFNSEDSVEKVAEFYTDTLENQGWEQSENMDMDNLKTSSWVKDGQKIQLTISVGDEDTGSSVMIVTGDE